MDISSSFFHGRPGFLNVPVPVHWLVRQEEEPLRQKHCFNEAPSNVWILLESPFHNGGFIIPMACAEPRPVCDNFLQSFQTIVDFLLTRSQIG